MSCLAGHRLLTPKPSPQSLSNCIKSVDNLGSPCLSSKPTPAQRKVTVVTSTNIAALGEEFCIYLRENGRSVDKDMQPECARRLVQDGFNLAIQTASNSILPLRDELMEAHPSAEISIHSGDLSTTAAAEKLLANVLLVHKRIDSVINSAGSIIQKPSCGSDVSDVDCCKLLAYSIFVDGQRKKCMERLVVETSRIGCRAS